MPRFDDPLSKLGPITVWYDSLSDPENPRWIVEENLLAVSAHVEKHEAIAAAYKLADHSGYPVLIQEPTVDHQ